MEHPAQDLVFPVKPTHICRGVGWGSMADFNFAFGQLENEGYSLTYHQLLIISHDIFGVHWFLQFFLNIFIHLHHLLEVLSLCRGYFWKLCLLLSNFGEIGRVRWSWFYLSESSSLDDFPSLWGGEKKRLKYMFQGLDNKYGLLRSKHKFHLLTSSSSPCP